MIGEKKALAADRPLGRRSVSRFWIVANNRTHAVEVLTVDWSGDEALPIFSHEEEAELFLGLGGAGESWRVRESSVGEIVSLLFGPCAGVKSVALDPSPMMPSEMFSLVRISRDRFVDLVAAPDRNRPSSGLRRPRSLSGRIGVPLERTCRSHDRSDPSGPDC